MKRIIALAVVLGFIVVSARAQSGDGHIALTTKYDRFKDETSVDIPLTEVWGSLYDGLRFLASYTQKGSTAIPPEKIIIAFMLVIKDEKPVRNRNLYVIADGQRMELGEMRDLGVTQPMAGLNVFAQQFGTTVTPEIFSKLAKSKKLEMKIDFIEFEVKPNLQDAIRRLADRAGIKDRPERDLKAAPSPPTSTGILTAHQWSFPKAGMAKKIINGVEFYDLGDNYLARFDTLNSLQIGIVVLPPNSAELIERVAKRENLKIASVDQGLCMVAIYKAVALNPGDDIKYLSPVSRENRVIHIFQLSPTSGVGASVSDDKTFVMIMPAPNAK